jgi:hypothetical protein
MEDDGEIMCESGKMTSSMKLSVKKGESKPIIDFPSAFEAPASRPITLQVPYKGNLFVRGLLLQSNASVYSFWN